MKPNQVEIGEALLKLLSSKMDEQCTADDAYNALALIFGERIPKDDLDRPFQNSKNKWANDVQFARLKLVDKGFIVKPKKSKRGIWKLSKEGLEEVRKSISTPTEINKLNSGNYHIGSGKTSERTELFYPEVEEDGQSIYYEGAKKQIVVNSYERNIDARQKCLDHFGYSCSVCKIDFARVYGEIGKEFIHVHHLKEISKIGEKYIINPITDLKPICPNCHSMLHKRNPCFTIEELVAIMNEQQPT